MDVKQMMMMMMMKDTSIVLEKPSACERCQDCFASDGRFPPHPQSGTIARLT